jgi:hypothetical protein
MTLSAVEATAKNLPEIGVEQLKNTRVDGATDPVCCAQSVYWVKSGDSGDGSESLIRILMSRRLFTGMRILVLLEGTKWN